MSYFKIKDFFNQIFSTCSNRIYELTAVSNTRGTAVDADPLNRFRSSAMNPAAGKEVAKTN